MKKKLPTSVPPQGVVRLGDILPQLIVRYGLHHRRDLEGLTEAWNQAVGEPYAALSRPVGLKRGTLEIAVPHNAFVQELSFRNKELLDSMRNAMKDEKINKIKYVVSK